jgi:hypothetical protein
MRVNEVTQQLRTFTASVRVSVGSRSIIVRTRVQSDDITQARLLLLHLYGAGNVLHIT